MSVVVKKIFEGSFPTFLAAEVFLDKVLEENGDIGITRYSIEFDKYSDEDAPPWNVEVRYTIEAE